jgi:hypothetical protein
MQLPLKHNESLMLDWRFPLLVTFCVALAFSPALGAPGDPFGGDDAGCAPSSKATLACSVQAAKTVERMRRSILRCHAYQAAARFDEVIEGSISDFDEEDCEDRADAALEEKLVKLSRRSSCAGSTTLGTVASHVDELRAGSVNPISLDSLSGTFFCDASSGTEIDPDGDDAGYVPSVSSHLECGARLTKLVAKLAGATAKCHRSLASGTLDGEAVDDEACELRAIESFVSASASLNDLCPPCLDSAARVALAEDLVGSMEIASASFYPCPDPSLHPGTPSLDEATLVALGVRLPISGDVDRDATVSVRYRENGEMTWKDGLPLLRVRPETVDGRIVPEEFAGSIFDLRPDTTYDIELRAVDSDGTVDETFLLSAATRPVPGDPAMPNLRPVATAAELAAALFDAAPGDVIELADGVYTGAFVSFMSGTPENPIVIRGTSTNGTIVDGGGCTDCNVIELYGSYVHVERMTLRSAVRGIRFQAAGAESNVLRRVRIEDVRLGVGTRENQKNFYICDNRLTGRLVWPQNYFDGSGVDHSDDDGIRIDGDGHVVCHNDLYGFGDSIKNGQDGARSFDVYGNEIRSAYDNGIELDLGEGNLRALRNRMTNAFVPLSFQPVYGGPAYALRNIAVNVIHEQLKFHGVFGNSGPSGVLAYNNTFVSQDIAVTLQTPVASHNFELTNNLFVTRASHEDGLIVDWTGPVDGGRFEYDGFFPDGIFRFNLPPLGHVAYDSFAGMQTAGLETQGTLLAEPIFASGLTAPADFQIEMSAQDVTLDALSNAVDAGAVLANVTDGFTGAAPDLGALERGCPLPIYGVRPEGIDETNEPFGCAP